MIPYQRYLRERKEVQEEQKLNEAVGSGSGQTRVPNNAARSKKARRGPKTVATTEPESPLRQVELPFNTPPTDSAAPTPLTGAEEKPFSKLSDRPMGLRPDAAAQSRIQKGLDSLRSKQPINPGAISGNTISEILSSAGANPSAIREVIMAVRTALMKAKLDVKDTSFLR